MPNQYIFKKAMLDDLAAQLEQHSDDCEPLTLLIMQRFIKYVEDFPAAKIDGDSCTAIDCLRSTIEEQIEEE